MGLVLGNSHVFCEFKDREESQYEVLSSMMLLRALVPLGKSNASTDITLLSYIA